MCAFIFAPPEPHLPMITLRKSEDRGHANHGWLDARHTFSFGSYHDPDHMGFSELRVINQDRIEAAQGFGTHGHQDMEIVTYVLSGILEHKDSMGNGSTILPGEVQLMSAGTGVSHSEFNGSETEELRLLQMWILPSERGTQPRYEQKEFPASERTGKLRLVVSPDGMDGSLTIGQDVRLFVGSLCDGDTWRLELEAWRREKLQRSTEGDAGEDGGDHPERVSPADAALLVIAANHFGGTALEHFNDLALASTPVIDSGNPGQGLVTIKYQRHLASTQIEIIAAFQG